MIIKKFIGKTENEATEAAKKELGENMVIMNVKFVKPKGPFAFLKKKMVEVTAALEDDEEPLRQIRKIAMAQDKAASKMTKQSDSTDKKDDTSSFSVAVGDDTKLSAHALKTKNATEIVAQAGNRTGINPSKEESGKHEASNNIASKNSIEEKLDNLQNLIETQINRESEAVKNSKAVAQKTSSITSHIVDDEIKKDPILEKKEELDQQDKEIDRFIKLLYNTMIDNEVDEKYANEIIGDAEKSRKPGTTMDFLLGSIYQKMILKFGKSEGILPGSDQSPRIVFFIGPTGVGKTTTIAKIASSYSLNEKKKVALLTTDTYRIAATDQLRTYASILGVPFRVIYEPDELENAVSDFKDCDYIFVDSAGHSHKNEQLLQKQKEYLEVVGENPKQIFLVLSATTKYRDLKKIADNYKEISDYQLVFTKLDETSEYGNLYNMKCETGAPIAYVTCGQNVPDDIESFNAQKTVKQLLGGKK